MDYVGILKKAWNVTWRYKILWVFGFFAGAGGGFGGGNGGGSGYGGSGNGSQPNMDAAQFQRFIEQYAGVIVLGVVVLLLLGLVMLVISVSARGGLIHLVNEAEEGREVRAGAGWKVGFSKWGRVFGVGFLAALPLLVLFLIILGMLATAGVAALRAGSAQNIGAAFGGMLAGGVCLVVVIGIVAVVIGVILGIVAELAYCYVVLQDRRVVESLKLGWSDLFGKRGVFLMFLVQTAVGIVFGIVVAIVAAIIAIPGIVAIAAGAWPVGALMVLVGALVLMVPVAVYGAFYHAAWTIFFRRMTGMEPAPAVVAPVGSAGYPGAFPPAPPMTPAPPAPPTMPAPPAPTMAPAPPAPPAPPVAPTPAAPVAPSTPAGPPDA